MYDDLIACLERKGITSFFQNPNHLVIAAEVPNFPSSNSFWVTIHRGHWHLGTWSPRVYRVPTDQDMCELCADVLRSSETAIYSVAQNLILRFKLEELREKEVDEIMGSTEEGAAGNQ